jgi:hypothetical protein
MKFPSFDIGSSLLVVCLSSVTLTASPAHAAELVGFARMPANTFAVGPTSGQFAGAGAGGNPLPLVNRQPVQGVSGVLPGPTRDSFYVMPDNGFGAKTNSADALLRVYAVQPEFRVWKKERVRGSGLVTPVEFRSGRPVAAFTDATFISLSDPEQRLGFQTVSQMAFYPNGSGTVAVDPRIQARHLLTGADLDIEAVRQDAAGHWWFGDEFGPFLVETDARGRVLHAEARLPNVPPPGSTAVGLEVQSPQNPYLAGQTPNLGQSKGFEGMAVSPSGMKLYPLLEGTVVGDDAVNGTTGKLLRISEFDTPNRVYTPNHWLYQLEAPGTNIGDMTAINDHQFLVIERDGNTATSGGTPYKKIFVADIAGVAPGGLVSKVELVDLMNVEDPHDLDGDGSALFTFPFVTIESVLILNPTTLLVINDNNYPGAGGRDTNSDNTEFIKIRLNTALDVATGGVE